MTALNHNQAMQTLHNGENARRRKHQQYPRGRLEAIAGLKAVKEATWDYVISEKLLNYINSTAHEKCKHDCMGLYHQ